ncbi:MAG: 2-C-methyl-D-erythritol 2,4-cyclodiphosphate synthase [Pirellulaceae bacterium]
MPDLPGLRIGIGHDTHALIAGSPLRLGGVVIPHDKRLQGHSDADVLLHAVTDALLGAASLGDIGELFPNTDPANRGRDSAEMLRIACERVRAEGWQIVNLDCIVFAERPKLSGYKQAISERIGHILQVDPRCVGVKAKTGEGLDAVGEERAIQAQCVALLMRAPTVATSAS